MLLFGHLKFVESTNFPQRARGLTALRRVVIQFLKPVSILTPTKLLINCIPFRKFEGIYFFLKG